MEFLGEGLLRKFYAVSNNRVRKGEMSLIREKNVMCNNVSSHITSKYVLSKVVYRKLSNIMIKYEDEA